MGKKLTTSQLTFVDITDQRKLSVYLASNFATIQTLDGTTFNPSWNADGGLTIDPQIYIDQQQIDLTNTALTVTWKRKDGNATAGQLQTITTANGTIEEKVVNKKLVVNGNMLEHSTSGMITYVCEIEYQDSETSQTVTATDQMTYVLIKAPEDAKSCHISSSTQVFKYSNPNDNTSYSPNTIKLEAITNGVTVSQWQYQTISGEWAGFTTDSTLNIFNNADTLYVCPNTHSDLFGTDGSLKIKLVTSNPNVYDIITINKLYDGADGAAGAAGLDAYTVILTNESHTFPGGVSYAINGSIASTTVNAYKGSDQQLIIIKSVNGVGPSESNVVYDGFEFKVIDNNSENPTITFTINSNNFTMTNGSIPIVMTVNNVEFTKYFSWSVSYAGSGACSVSIEASSQIFKSSDGINYTPSKITLTPHVQNLTLENCDWEYRASGTDNWTAIDDENDNGMGTNVYFNSNRELTVPIGFFNNQSASVVFRCFNVDQESNVTYVDSVTIVKLTDGQSGSAAYTVILSNEMHCIGTDSNSCTTEESSFECCVIAYEGQNQLVVVEANAEVTEGHFKVVPSENLPTGVSVEQNTPGIITVKINSGTKLETSNIINLDIYAESDPTPITKYISYAPSKSGTSGTNAVTFMLWAPQGDVFSNQDGTLLLEAQMYDGATNISKSENVNYIWEKYTSGQYECVQDEKNGNDGGNVYTVHGTDVANIQTYRCTAKYKNNDYTSNYTMEDKSDNYVSEMLTVGGTTFKNNQGGSAVYVIVRANGVEKDPFPSGCLIGTKLPETGTNGQYYWLVDHINKKVQLKKHNGAKWEDAAETSDDIQEFNYIWSLMDKDGNDLEFDKYGKVIYLSCHEIYSIGTLQCDVRVKETASVNRFGNTVVNDESYVVSDYDNGDVEVGAGTVTDDGEGNVTVS